MKNLRYVSLAVFYLPFFWGVSFPALLRAQELPNAANWTMTFDEEFSDSQLNRQKWDTRYYGSPNSESYVIENGVMKLRLMPHFPRPTFPDGPARVSHINSSRSFAQRYGWFEIRARVSSQSGFAAAFWLIPWDPGYNRLVSQGGTRTNPDEPYEIDIFELPGRNPHGGLFNIFYGLDVGGHRSQESYRRQFPHLDLTREFHTYALDWQPRLLRWLIDGKEIARSGHSPQVPFYIMLDQYEGTGWIGPVRPGTAYPKDFEIDYVRVFQRKEFVRTPKQFTQCSGFADPNSIPVKSEFPQGSFQPGKQLQIHNTNAPARAADLGIESMSVEKSQGQPILIGTGRFTDLRRQVQGQGTFRLQVVGTLVRIKMIDDKGAPWAEMRLLCQ